MNSRNNIESERLGNKVVNGWNKLKLILIELDLWSLEKIPNHRKGILYAKKAKINKWKIVYKKLWLTNTLSNSTNQTRIDQANTTAQKESWTMDELSYNVLVCDEWRRDKLATSVVVGGCTIDTIREQSITGRHKILIIRQWYW